VELWTMFYRVDMLLACVFSKWFVMFHHQQFWNTNSLIGWSIIYFIIMKYLILHANGYIILHYTDGHNYMKYSELKMSMWNIIYEKANKGQICNITPIYWFLLRSILRKHYKILVWSIFVKTRWRCQHSFVGLNDIN